MFIKTHTSKFVRFILMFVLIVGVFGLIPAHASPTILYVKSNASGANNGTSWADAYTNLQSALSIVSSGDEIWVAAGTYSSITLKNGVSVYGGFAGTETLRM